MTEAQTAGATQTNERALGYAALATAGTLWGTGFVFGKFALTELSVGQMLFLRFFFASFALIPVLAYEARRRPIRVHARDFSLILVAAALGVPVQFILQFDGLSKTTVSHASLMVGILPVLLAAAAAMFSHERLDRIGWIGLVASVVGAGLVALGASASAGVNQGPTLGGDMLVISSLFAAVAWIVMSQALMRRGYSPVMTSAVVILTGSVLLAGWVFATDGMPDFTKLSMTAWGSVAAMGILATATTTVLWNWGLGRVPASQAGVFINLEPVVGAILGVALFAEVMGALAIAGGLLIVGAAVVVSRRAPT
ncbi:MAG TPA: DMT family transporter [Gemmatimonadaceae bacterium]